MTTTNECSNSHVFTLGSGVTRHTSDDFCYHVALGMRFTHDAVQATA